MCNRANISSNTPRNIFDVHHLVDLPMNVWQIEENRSMSVANASHSASMTRQDGLSASSSCYEKSLCPVWKATLFVERLFWHRMLSHFTCTFQREKCSLISIETSVLTFELQHGPFGHPHSPSSEQGTCKNSGITRTALSPTSATLWRWIWMAVSLVDVLKQCDSGHRFISTTVHRKHTHAYAYREASRLCFPSPPSSNNCKNTTQ